MRNYDCLYTMKILSGYDQKQRVENCVPKTA